jgi:ribonuclease P protein component
MEEDGHRSPIMYPLPMRPHGFPPALRILKGPEFDRVFRGGARAGDDLIVVNALPNRRRHSRLGLAVGKGVGGSVARNRVKRLLREAFRLRRGDLPPAHDLVVVAKAAGPDSYSLESCERSLLALAAKAAARFQREGAGRRGRPGPPA